MGEEQGFGRGWVLHLGCRPFKRVRRSLLKGEALPSTPFSAGKSDTIFTSTSPSCTWYTSLHQLPDLADMPSDGTPIFANRWSSKTMLCLSLLDLSVFQKNLDLKQVQNSCCT